jgi:peroxiredoxin
MQRRRGPRRVVMRTPSRNAIVVIGTIVALFSAVFAYALLQPGMFRPPEPGVGIGIGQFAPGFTIQDVNGTEWGLSSHRGQVVLIDFMGANCSTCAFEMSEGGLQSLYATYSARGFTILSIDVGPSPSFGGLGARNPAEAWRFVHGLNADGSQRWTAGTWPVALDNQGLVLDYGVVPLPMKYLVDESGKVAWKLPGYRGQVDHDALEAQISALLG